MTTKQDDAGLLISFPLSGENVIQIWLRSKVTRDEFARIRQIVELLEPCLVETQEPTP